MVLTLRRTYSPMENTMLLLFQESVGQVLQYIVICIMEGIVFTVIHTHGITSLLEKKWLKTHKLDFNLPIHLLAYLSSCILVTLSCLLKVESTRKALRRHR